MLMENPKERCMNARGYFNRYNVNGLIQQIAELDETYRMGSLDEEIYQKRRERLKARLAALIDEDK